MYVGPWQEYKLMQAIEELRDENSVLRDVAREVESDGQGLRSSSSHLHRLSATGDSRPASMSDERDVALRRKGCMVCPMRGAGDVYLDLRTYVSPTSERFNPLLPQPPSEPRSSSSGNQIHNRTEGGSQASFRRKVHPFEIYPSGHYMSDVYAVNYPRSHFAALPPLGTRQASSQGDTPPDPLLDYLHGNADCPPVAPGKEDGMSGVAYVHPHTGELVDSRQQGPKETVRRVPLDTELLGVRASHRALKRCFKSTANPKLPSSEKLALKGIEGQVLSEIEINKRIERRLHLQALYEGRLLAEKAAAEREGTPAPAPAPDVEESDEPPEESLDTVLRRFGPSSLIEVKAAPLSEEEKQKIKEKIEEELKAAERGDVVEDNEDELHELLDWAQNLDPEAIE